MKLHQKQWWENSRWSKIWRSYWIYFVIEKHVYWDYITDSMGETPRSYEEIGRFLKLSRERIRQITWIALSKLQKSNMIDNLTVYIERWIKGHLVQVYYYSLVLILLKKFMLLIRYLLILYSDYFLHYEFVTLLG